MTGKIEKPLTRDINTKAGEVMLVCDDPASGQSISFMEKDGRQLITHAYQESGETRAITLTDSEVAEMIAWKNSGRRNSFWNWPGMDALRKRGKIDSP